MRILTLVFIASLPWAGWTQAQDNPFVILDMGEFLRGTPSTKRVMGGEAYGTIGTPYVYKEFLNGNIYFTDNSVILNRPINYDCYNNRVLLHYGEEDHIMNSRQIESLEFEVSDDSYSVFRQVFVLEKKKTVFMKVLYEGKSTLYKYYFKNFHKADYTGPYSQERRYDEYLDDQEWYLEPGDQEVQKLKPRKKAILQILESRKGEIEHFLKTEDIDLKSDQDLVRLIEFYDGLAAESP